MLELHIETERGAIVRAKVTQKIMQNATLTFPCGCTGTISHVEMSVDIDPESVPRVAREMLGESKQ